MTNRESWLKSQRIFKNLFTTGDFCDILYLLCCEKKPLPWRTCDKAGYIEKDMFILSMSFFLHDYSIYGIISLEIKATLYFTSTNTSWNNY